MPDEKYERLKELARQRQTSVNRLFDDMATALLADADAQTRFALRAARGEKLGTEHGQALLKKALGN
ncbi:MAG: toxin-antitoxin system HicB family antitoxin [Wenzhouxiangella sp.]|nr:MAG: toxin-antitoxin system HicB family antitoxin [Wenzhouxiangella sp.]